MKKSIRRITALLVAALASLSLVFLVACGDTAEPTEYYTVTVVDESEAAINGTASPFDTIQVQFCASGAGGACHVDTPSLDANGKASISKSVLDTALGNPTSILVHLLGVPTGYKYTDNYQFDATTKDITITLNQIVQYTVTVTMPDTASPEPEATKPATGVNVAFMNGSTPVLAAQTVDTNGQIVVPDRDTVLNSTIVVSNIETGYKMPGGSFTVASNEIGKNITLVPITYYTVTVNIPETIAEYETAVKVGFEKGGEVVKEPVAIDQNNQVSVDRDEVVGSTVVVSGIRSMYYEGAGYTVVDEDETEAEIDVLEWVQTYAATDTVAFDVELSEENDFVEGTSYDMRVAMPSTYAGEEPLVYTREVWEGTGDAVIDPSLSRSYIFTPDSLPQTLQFVASNGSGGVDEITIKIYVASEDVSTTPNIEIGAMSPTPVTTTSEALQITTTAPSQGNYTVRVYGANAYTVVVAFVSLGNRITASPAGTYQYATSSLNEGVSELWISVLEDGQPVAGVQIAIQIIASVA